MNITTNQDLKKHSTMRLGGEAKHFVKVATREELIEALEWAESNSLPSIIVGGGSNIIWKDEGFSGLLIENCILGYELQEIDPNNATLTVGAGENWDAVVKKTVLTGYYTLAPLSLIPGKTGATPIQNVGAYGQEVSNCILTIQVYDKQDKKTINMRGSDCKFGYRTSRFKNEDKNRFAIVSVTFSLTKENTLKPYYDSISQYLNQKNLKIETAEDLREAVIAIRYNKLPSPDRVANNGSFFANPIIDSFTFNEVKENHPNIAHWPLADDNIKVSAAWLIENAGFKDFTDPETGMATWPNQPLVFINESAKSTADLLIFKQKIVETVQKKFGITLEQEPELLP